MRTNRLLPWLGCVLLTAAAGCRPAQSPGAGAAELPVIPVSQPVVREVRDYEDFTGQTDAVQVVDIRARVTGYLNKMPFKEGSEVKEGDLLFEIDARPYQAQLDQAVAQVASNEESYKVAKSTYTRDRAAPNAVSPQEIEQDYAAMQEADAKIKAAKASTEVYKLNIEFSKVVAPITGQVSRYYVTRGNLIAQDSTLLTTIVSLDPIYVYFEMDEPTLLRMRRAIQDGRIKRSVGGFPVLMGLQGEDGYPFTGHINFFNNQVNSATGSISLRGVFPNPQPDVPRLAGIYFGMFASPSGWEPLQALAMPASGTLPGGIRLMSPGMFVRIRLPIGDPHKALLVIDRAIQSDQGLKYVYVIGADGKAEYRRVTTGPLEEDGLRDIRDGLEADDWVVVGALQQVRPKVQVQPEEGPMPTLASTGGVSKSAGPNGAVGTAAGGGARKKAGKQ
jgi:membrane fusion protein, multidrug efflux system